MFNLYGRNGKGFPEEDVAFEWGFANRQLRGRGRFTYKEPVSMQTTHVCSWNHRRNMCGTTGLTAIIKRIKFYPVIFLILQKRKVRTWEVKITAQGLQQACQWSYAGRQGSPRTPWVLSLQEGGGEVREDLTPQRRCLVLLQQAMQSQQRLRRKRERALCLSVAEAQVRGNQCLNKGRERARISKGWAICCGGETYELGDSLGGKGETERRRKANTKVSSLSHSGMDFSLWKQGRQGKSWSGG